jgi:hypothetical protein
MVIKLLSFLSLFLLASYAAQVPKKNGGIVRIPLSHRFRSGHEKRQIKAGLPQVGGEIYLIQGILNYWYFSIEISKP